MGVLRLVLALAVVTAHAGPIGEITFFGGGAMAVDTFYVLSGFYMALVLSTRYRTSVREFYFNRFLRLYPIYWMLLGGYLLIASVYWLVLGRPLGALAFWCLDPSPLQQTWAVVSNFTILGSDAAQLFSNLPDTKTPGLNRLLAIEPAWTVAVEIVFYLGIPHVIRQTKTIQFGILVLALLLRGALWFLGGGHWAYFFAPAAWPFFMGGVFTYHLMTWYEAQPWFAKHAPFLGRILLLGLVGIILFYQRLPDTGFQNWPYYAVNGLALPWIFAAFKTSRWDSAVAAWSYPIYLSHSVVISLSAQSRYFAPGPYKIYAVLACSLAASAVVLYYDKRIQTRFKLRVSPIGPHQQLASCQATGAAS